MPRRALGELGSQAYWEYLASPEWRAKRAAAFRHHGRKCKRCGRERNLHVHHLTYARLGRELMTDLTVWCNKCHTLYHKQFGTPKGGLLQKTSEEFATLVVEGNVTIIPPVPAYLVRRQATKKRRRNRNRKLPPWMKQTPQHVSADKKKTAVLNKMNAELRAKQERTRRIQELIDRGCQPKIAASLANTEMSYRTTHGTSERSG